MLFAPLADFWDFRKGDDKMNTEKKYEKKFQWKLILIILGCIMFACFVITGLGNILPKASAPTASAVVNDSMVATVQSADAALTLAAPTLVPTITPTIAPTATPPQLGESLNSFMALWNGKTDMQRNDLIGQSVGKWVDWYSTVSTVRTTGEIIVNIPTCFLGSITLEGVPHDVAESLSPNQEIHFTGKLVSIITMIDPMITISNAQIIP
jgi:hypothetical protein